MLESNLFMSYSCQARTLLYLKPWLILFLPFCWIYILKDFTTTKNVIWFDIDRSLWCYVATPSWHFMNFTEVQICITEIEFSSFFTVNYSVNISNWNISEKPGGDNLVSAQKLETVSEEGRMKCIHIVKLQCTNTVQLHWTNTVPLYYTKTLQL